MNQQEIAEYLNTELKALFPTSGVSVYVRSVLGEPNIYIGYTNAVDRSQCSSGILENDPANMRYYIETDGVNKYSADRPIRHFTNKLDEAGVTFRKINGKSELEVAEKLLTWFRKHRDAILSVGLSIK